MTEVYIKTLGETIEVSDEGRFELPSRSYTAAELKKIAVEVNRAERQHRFVVEKEDEYGE